METQYKANYEYKSGIKIIWGLSSSIIGQITGFLKNKGDKLRMIN